MRGSCEPSRHVTAFGRSQDSSAARVQHGEKDLRLGIETRSQSSKTRWHTSFVRPATINQNATTAHTEKEEWPSGFIPRATQGCRLEQQPFESEDELQQLIAAYPELLDGEQMRPGDPRHITREQGIAETPGEHDRWAVDHLIIDQEAMPTLVEVKLRSNTEIRRTVVGQLLEYAAHAAQTWSADELRR